MRRRSSRGTYRSPRTQTPRFIRIHEKGLPITPTTGGRQPIRQILIKQARAAARRNIRAFKLPLRNKYRYKYRFSSSGKLMRRTKRC